MEKEKEKVKKIIDRYLKLEERLQKIVKKIEDDNQQLENIFARWNRSSGKITRKERDKAINLIDKLEGLADEYYRIEDTQGKIIESIPENIAEQTLEEALGRLPDTERLEMEKEMAEIIATFKRQEEKTKQYIA